MSKKVYKPDMKFEAYRLALYAQVEQEQSSGLDFGELVAAVLDRVCLILINEPATRDCYKQLLMRYYAQYFPWNPSRFAHPDDWFTHPDSPQPNSVIRCRSLLQKNFPQIQGKNYQKRMASFDTTRDNWYPKDEH